MAPTSIGIMRHAESWYDGMDPKKCSEHRPELTNDGERAAFAVGRRFQEFLHGSGIEHTEITVHDVGTPQTRATADILRQTLSTESNPDPAARPDSAEGLAPGKLSAYTTNALAFGEQWKEAAENLQGSCVIVGHDPQMSWLASQLISSPERSYVPWMRKPPPQDIALASGELLWLDRREGTAELRWVFSPSDPETTKALYDKIKSKMDTAKVLGTFLTALLTFVVTQLHDAKLPTEFAIAAGVGITLLVIAVALFFVTMFRYDELLMPTRFWSARPPKKTAQSGDFIHRPPGSAGRVLQQNMVHIWTNAFVPAVQAGGIGVALLAIAFLEPSNVIQWVATGAAIGAVGTALFVSWRNSTLQLGVND